MQPVPYTKPWFLGIANLRGTLAGVIDLASLLGHGVTRSEPALAESSLLAFNAALEVNAALLVDRLQGLRSADAFVRTEPAPEHSPAFSAPCISMKRATAGRSCNCSACPKPPSF